MDLQVAANNKLRLGAHGKGLWETDMPSATQLITQATMETTVEKNKEVSMASISSGIYPNPSQGQITISINNIPKAQRAIVKVYNTAGIVQYQFSAELERGDNLLKRNLGSLKAGTYQVIIEVNGKRIVQKLVRL
jgi:hypothetical protein